MKFVHIFVNHANTGPFIDFVNANFDKFDHVFYIIRGLPEDKIPINKSENVIIINKLFNIHNGFRLLADLNRSWKIFLHGYFSPFLVFTLFFQPWILKKCYWYIWGGDLHIYHRRSRNIWTRIDHFARKSTIRRFGKILTQFRGDYELAKEYYKVRGEHGRVVYNSILDVDTIDKITDKNFFKKIDSTIRIQIGNSADSINNHFEIIDLLKKFYNEDIKVYCLLAYGDEDYSKRVRDYGELNLKDKFIGVTEYMGFADFVQYMNGLDILLFNDRIQHGMGNIYLAILLRKKIFINRESTIWSYLNNELEITTGCTNDIHKIDFHFFSSNDSVDSENSRNKIRKILEDQNIISLWNAQFYEDQEK